MKKNKVLSTDFFNRPILTICNEFIGKSIIRKINKNTYSYIITEIEAYDGPNDMASHACFGKNKQNEPMFASAGYFYIYLVYGIHWMLNITTGPKGYPATILIRGTREVSGPGRLTKNLKIDKALNKKIDQPCSNLWFETNNLKIKKKDIITTPRIGIDYAGPIWGKKPYRFLLNLNKKI